MLKERKEQKKKQKEGEEPLAGATPLVTPKTIGLELVVPLMQPNRRTQPSQEKLREGGTRVVTHH